MSYYPDLYYLGRYHPGLYYLGRYHPGLYYPDLYHPGLYYPDLYCPGLYYPTHVSGVIRPGKFTAILGGSGAGKTSLMSCLLGREVITSGSIEFLAAVTGANHGGGEGGNSSSALEPLSSTQQQRLVGFVPQFDVFLRVMTVVQLLTHSARTRLPSTMTESDIQRVVGTVMVLLGVDHLAHCVAGGDSDGTGTGLGAGDRKLVNIAIELVSQPSVLFMDEPTSSIDASSALNVAQIARWDINHPPSFIHQ